MVRRLVEEKAGHALMRDYFNSARVRPPGDSVVTLREQHDVKARYLERCQSRAHRLSP
jgi:hypothetical protein